MKTDKKPFLVSFFNGTRHTLWVFLEAALTIANHTFQTLICSIKAVPKKGSFDSGLIYRDKLVSGCRYQTERKNLRLTPVSMQNKTKIMPESCQNRFLWIAIFLYAGIQKKKMKYWIIWSLTNTWEWISQMQVYHLRKCWISDKSMQIKPHTILTPKHPLIGFIHLIYSIQLLHYSMSQVCTILWTIN